MSCMPVPLSLIAFANVVTIGLAMQAYEQSAVQHECMYARGLVS